MPSISKAEFSQRRHTFMAQMGTGSIAIFPAAGIPERNNSVEYRYRQNSNFQYLCGFPEPEAVLVLLPGRTEGSSILFCRERSPEREQWEGKRQGQDGAVINYGIDQAFSFDQIDEILPTLIDGCHRLYSNIGEDAEFDQQVQAWVDVVRAQARMGAQAPTQFHAAQPILHEMRLIKSAAEVAIMQKAMNISAQAHINAMRAAKEGRHEYSLEAELEYEFRKNGAQHVAYNSIVASGNNACILHYTENDQALYNGDLVLIDAGCEIDCYASDISRTFPVSGTFSPEQKAIYEIVLQANIEAFKHISPKHRWYDAHNAAVKVITQGLLDLGILQGELEQLIQQQAYRPYYMHGTGHWLGLDVHDVGDYKVDGIGRPLRVGMVMTVEPGIYISPDNLQVEAKWRGIGVRIEDNVVVTEDGCQVLTNKVPKTVAEIEALMAHT